MEKIISEWADIENFVGHKVPMFLKILLWKSGYDSMISIKEISHDAIAELERYIQKERLLNEIFSNSFSDNTSDNDDSINGYREQEIFAFLPGHRSFLLNLPRYIQNMQLEAVNNSTNGIESTSKAASEYSRILTELVQTAKANVNKSKHAYSYNDVIKYFSTYIFLLCGRTCYETLNKNLPIPSTKTIRKFEMLL